MSEGMECFERAIHRVRCVYDDQVAEVIVKILAEELGDIRITFPGLESIKIYERNKMIKKAFRGNNYEELAILFKLSERQIRNIIKK